MAKARKKPPSAEPEQVPADESDVSGTFVSHLIELRNRLLYAAICVGLVTIALLFIVGPNNVYALLAQPLLRVLPKGASMIATDVVTPFFSPLKLTFAAAVVISIPYILYQIWAFVAPGLYKHERRLIIPLLFSSTLLFYLGMAFAYLVVFPIVFQFFVETTPEGVTMMTDIKAYLDFVFTMFFAFGVAFEIPVALVLLAKMGVVNPHALSDKRPYIVLGIFVIAAVLTPPDAFSQTSLALPMLVLFEIGLFVAKRVCPRDEAAERGEEAS